MKNSTRRKSDRCFPFTQAVTAYATFQRTQDAVHRYLSKKLGEWGLSVPRYGVIMQLYDHESVALSEIGSLIFRCNSNVTTLIDRMERDGIIEKIASDKDRRVRRIRLTEKGRELAPKAIKAYRAFLDEMMRKSLSSKEQRVFMDMLNRVKARCAQTDAGQRSSRMREGRGLGKLRAKGDSG